MRMPPWILLAAILPVMMAASPCVRAAEPELETGGTSWQQLSEEQRKLLADQEAGWDRLPAARREALARRSQHLLDMPPERRKEALKRLHRWQSLDSDQRRELRRRHRQFNDLPPCEQQRIRKNFHRFQNLTPEQRRELRERYEALTPQERQRLKEKMKEKKGEKTRQE